MDVFRRVQYGVHQEVAIWGSSDLLGRSGASGWRRYFALKIIGYDVKVQRCFTNGRFAEKTRATMKCTFVECKVVQQGGLHVDECVQPKEDIKRNEK